MKSQRELFREKQTALEENKLDLFRALTLYGEVQEAIVTNNVNLASALLPNCPQCQRKVQLIGYGLVELTDSPEMQASLLTVIEFRGCGKVDELWTCSACKLDFYEI